MGLEVEDAVLSESGLVIEMDGNLWAGPDLISGDPNEINNNGKLFKAFLEKYPHLTVVNALDICEGLITRSRKTIKKDEESVLDFFIVCDKMKQYIKKMTIDEEKKYALTHYFKKKCVSHKTHSDHNTLVLDMQVPFYRTKNQKKEFFNFRNSDCQQTFREITTNSEELVKCFSNNGKSLSEQSNRWFKKLNGIFHRSFKKIRMNGNFKETKISQLSKTKSEIIQKIRTAGNDEGKSLNEELCVLEKQLSDLVAEKNRDKVVRNFGSLAQNDGTANINGMWALKKKVFPKNPPNLPVAKKDVDGRLITSHAELKKLYLDTFVHRLRPRPIREEYFYLF